MTKIYTLSDPETNEIRYVGKTIGTLNSRLSKHLCDSKRRGWKYHTINWINLLLKRGLKPKIELIEEVLDSEWKFWEKYWINQFKSWGFNLTNHRVGGEDGPTGYKQGKEIIQKRLETLKTSIAWSNFGKRHSEVMKEKYRKGELKTPYENTIALKTTEELLEIRYRAQETWKKNYNSNPQKKIDRASWSSIPVIAIFKDNTEKIYVSAAEAARELNLFSTQIIFVCRGKGFVSGGIKFKYFDKKLQEIYPPKN